MLYILCLGIAVSFDALFAGVAYGVKKITVSTAALLVVGAVTAACTAAAMAAANWAGALMEPQTSIFIGAALLLMVGLWSILQEYLLKLLTPKEASIQPQLCIKLGKLMINILADPEAVDVDRSRSISPGEAAILGLALGLDNMAATFAASLVGFLPLYTPLIMAVLQTGLIWGGIVLGGKFLPESIKERCPYLSGALLILLGVMRLVK